MGYIQTACGESAGQLKLQQYFWTTASFLKLSNRGRCTNADRTDADKKTDNVVEFVKSLYISNLDLFML